MESIDRRRFVTHGLAATSGLAGGFVAATAARPSDAGVAPTEVDVGFCTDMTAHHVQALAICQRVLGRDTGDEVQAAASEVLQNQAIEVGQMRAWLVDWGRSTAEPGTVMAWMHTGVPLTEMMGYASDDDLTALSQVTGRDQGRWWLRLMRAHHEGGVAMATAAEGLASADKVVRLAGWQAQQQTFEIGQYDQLLATSYA